jgi:hypothetical protein
VKPKSKKDFLVRVGSGIHHEGAKDTKEKEYFSEPRDLGVSSENRYAETIPAGFGTNILSYRRKPVCRRGRLRATKMDAGLRRHDDSWKETCGGAAISFSADERKLMNTSSTIPTYL